MDINNANITNFFRHTRHHPKTHRSNPQTTNYINCSNTAESSPRRAGTNLYRPNFIQSWLRAFRDCEKRKSDLLGMVKDRTNPKHPNTHQLNNPHQSRIPQLTLTAVVDKNATHP